MHVNERKGNCTILEFHNGNNHHVLLAHKTAIFFLNVLDKSCSGFQWHVMLLRWWRSATALNKFGPFNFRGSSVEQDNLIAICPTALLHCCYHIKQHCLYPLMSILHLCW